MKLNLDRMKSRMFIRTLLVSLLVLLFVMLVTLTSVKVTNVRAIAPPSTELYGYVVVNGRFAPRGTVITVYDSDKVLCGNFTIKSKGKYGLLSCRGDDPETTVDEGAEPGDELYIFVNQDYINTSGSIVWQQGKRYEANLVVGDVYEALPLLENPQPAETWYEKLGKNARFFFSALLAFLATLLLIVFHRKKDKKLFFALLVVFFSLFLPLSTKAFPPLPTEFYGNVTRDNSSVSSNTVISAYDSDGILCGRFAIVHDGHYGLLSCNGDDNSTDADEGAVDNEEIRFYINDTVAYPTPKPYWLSGSFAEINLDYDYAPILEPIGNLTATEDQPFHYDVNASDPNGNPITFYDNATFFDINPATGEMSFTPLNEHVGNHTINISVSDGYLSDYEIINLEVLNTNDAPYFDPPLRNFTINESAPFVYDVNYTDVDIGDTVMFFDNATQFDIDNITGLINWTPQYTDVGNWSVMLMVCDDSGAENNCTNGTIHIEVLDVNNPPILHPIGNQFGRVGQLFYLDVNATDYDNDTLTFYDNTTLFEINNVTGVISFTPNSSQNGSYKIEVWVSDGEFNDSETFLLVIGERLYCGDGICSMEIGENCQSCSKDCGPCTGAPPTVRRAGGAGGEGEGEGEAEGGVERGARYEKPYVCIPKWVCTEWSECIDGMQKRTCKDVNHCPMPYGKPAELRSCIVASCYDGIKNCHDGLCEEGVDCGGPCPPCKIFAKEERYAKPPTLERPELLGCGDGFCDIGEECSCPSDCRSFPETFPWGMLSPVLFATLIFLFGMGVNYILYHNAYFSQRRYSSNIRRLALLWTFVLFLSLIISSYTFMFAFCVENLIKYSWIVVLVVIVTAMLGWFIITETSYPERRLRKKLEAAIDFHERALRNMLNYEEGLIQDLEARLRDELSQLEGKEPEEARLLIYGIYELITQLSKKPRREEELTETEDVLMKKIGEAQNSEALLKLAESRLDFKQLMNDLIELKKLVEEKRELRKKLEAHLSKL